jgi:hypothetical protein
MLCQATPEEMVEFKRLCEDEWLAVHRERYARLAHS